MYSRLLPKLRMSEQVFWVDFWVEQKIRVGLELENLAYNSGILWFKEFSNRKGLFFRW